MTFERFLMTLLIGSSTDSAGQQQQQQQEEIRDESKNDNGNEIMNVAMPLMLTNNYDKGLLHTLPFLKSTTTTTTASTTRSFHQHQQRYQQRQQQHQQPKRPSGSHNIGRLSSKTTSLSNSNSRAQTTMMNTFGARTVPTARRTASRSRPTKISSNSHMSKQRTMIPTA